MKRKNTPCPVINTLGFTVKEVMEGLLQYKPDDLVYAADVFSASLTNAVSLIPIVDGVCVSTLLPDDDPKEPISEEARAAAQIAGLTVEKSDVFGYGFEAGQEHALSHQWVSVEDWFPEPGVNVFVFIPAEPACDLARRYEVAYWDREDWYTTDGEHIRPTHWMSIPTVEH